MPTAKGVHVHRSRDGCWTCRKRRKKCDGSGPPCGSCTRLNLKCDTETKLVWEDDSRRVGMKRRGPATTKARARASASASHEEYTLSDNSRYSGDFDYGSASASTTASASGDLGTLAISEKIQQTSPPLFQTVSLWPFTLDQAESSLLNHYIDRFSRTYPAFATAENPFLRVFLPLSMRSRVVLDALLALSGVQSWKGDSFAMAQPMFQLRHKAIRGCMGLVSKVMSTPGSASNAPLLQSIEELRQPGTEIPDMDDIISLLATCVLLILFEKLSGEREDAAATHLQFFARILPVQELLFLTRGGRKEGRSTVEEKPWTETVRFLSSLFLYNDLVRSTSNHIPTLSNFYVGTGAEEMTTIMNDTTEAASLPSHRAPSFILGPNPTSSTVGRFTLPSLMARCSAGDLSVTDHDIEAWDGRLDWFPSFSLVPSETRCPCEEKLPTADSEIVLDPTYASLTTLTSPHEWSELGLVVELYRIAATVYRKQCTQQNTTYSLYCLSDNDNGDTQMGNLPSWAIQLLQQLPPESRWENCLLWPIGIVARELSSQHERDYIATRLFDIENRLQIKLYHDVRNQLRADWEARDEGYAGRIRTGSVMCG